MERIGIIAANNIRYSPYILFYTQILDEYKIPYELIYPNRNSIDERWNGVSHSLPWNNKLGSLVNYLLFTLRTIRIIKKKKYTKLIVLTGSNAVCMSLWLRIHYNKKYIVDIRDFSSENKRLYAWLEKCALESAKYRIISSNKFKCFLPKMKYYTVNNISFSEDKQFSSWTKHRTPITIGYIGAVGYLENVKALIRLVRNDQRFNFFIYGSGPDQEKIELYVKKANSPRIKYYGSYEPEHKERIISNVDILFNAYGNDSPLLLYALSNKLYDALYYHKLILNSPRTYMEKKAGPCGFSIDLKNPMALDELYKWYNSLDERTIARFQKNTLNLFVKQNEKVKKKVVDFSIQKNHYL